MSARATKTSSPKATRPTSPTGGTAVSRRVTDEATRQLAKTAAGLASQHYVLRLYITGTTRASARAIEKVKDLCEEHLQGRYELEVIDIYQMPALAKDHQIVATPTLIKVLPSPLRRFIGDLSKVEKILFGLDLREKK